MSQIDIVCSCSVHTTILLGVLIIILWSWIGFLLFLIHKNSHNTMTVTYFSPLPALPSQAILSIPQSSMNIEEEGNEEERNENCDLSFIGETDTFSSSSRILTDNEWEIDRRNLKFQALLGRGAYGEVARAVLIEGNNLHKQVAVKRLRDDIALRAKEVENFLNEIEIAKSLSNHDHFINLIGCCSLHDGPLYLVFELAENGNLVEFLRSSGIFDSLPTTSDNMATMGRIPSIKISKRTLADFSIQVACGMSYLESEKIIHRDLAARNVLVTKDLVLKISDFGLARNLNRFGGETEYCERTNFDGAETSCRLPVKWMAPESLKKLVFSTHSDVWSFGVFLWEVQTMGGNPYEGLSDIDQLISFLEQGHRLKRPINCTNKIYCVMRRCWEYKPENRADFDDLLQHLKWIMENEYY